ncbi:similar to Saccharomyces cerevisiae YDR374C PHO92 Putative protein of unknown function [Maudiozyma saulgeensis]|uniref:YTH domain-containing protein n=1 Tax=Maudiozyma saulgeensis TaxID=1789683 RepID=A0A1X7R345_9SACH|nr:similar to Saccharomyces cerevisiae YDR374C PHO92 Putative protein of unknown function [Kazachstania saulgeensis]
MDIWDFEDPIGTPLKYSTKKGNYCIQNGIQFVEDDLLDEFFSITNQNINNIPRSMINNNTGFGTQFLNENNFNNYEQSFPSNIDQKNYCAYNSKFTKKFDYSYSNERSLKKKFNYSNNSAIIPQYFDIPPDSNFFIIKSFTLEHIQRAYEYNIWSSTHVGNKKLSSCFKSGKSDSKIFLFFSVNGSGKFCGVAEMISDLSKDLDTSIWENNSKYGSAFKIKWLCVRDIENRMFKHLIVPDNQNKPVTNSRDTQILPKEVGISMLNIFQSKHIKVTSFLDTEE